jgi:L-aminopeptidase/D-esterase-like protein
VPGGFGAAAVRCDDAHVIAFAVVNAVGDVVADDGSLLAGSTAPADALGFPAPAPFEEKGVEEKGVEEKGAEDRSNTTLVVVVTDAVYDKAGCHLVAQSAHDGFARALRPAHTRFDGDLAIALATATAPRREHADGLLDRVRIAAADATAAAIRSAVAVEPVTGTP